VDFARRERLLFVHDGRRRRVGVKYYYYCYYFYHHHHHRHDDDDLSVYIYICIDDTREYHVSHQSQVRAYLLLLSQHENISQIGLAFARTLSISEIGKHLSSKSPSCLCLSPLSLFALA